jgi:hypothetical protein
LGAAGVGEPHAARASSSAGPPMAARLIRVRNARRSMGRDRRRGEGSAGKWTGLLARADRVLTAGDDTLTAPG